MVTNLAIVFLSLEQQIDEIRWHATLIILTELLFGLDKAGTAFKLYRRHRLLAETRHDIGRMTCRVNGGQGERARRRTTQKAQDEWKSGTGPADVCWPESFDPRNLYRYVKEAESQTYLSKFRPQNSKIYNMYKTFDVSFSMLCPCFSLYRGEASRKSTLLISWSSRKSSVC